MMYLPQDKGTHFFWNQIVALVAYLLLLTLNIPNPITIAIVFGLGVGVAVELYQKKTGKGVPDVWDLVWGGAGVLLPFVPITAQGFLV